MLGSDLSNPDALGRLVIWEGGSLAALPGAPDEAGDHGSQLGQLHRLRHVHLVAGPDEPQISNWLMHSEMART
jgi:hypothetical protein